MIKTESHISNPLGKAIQSKRLHPILPRAQDGQEWKEKKVDGSYIPGVR